MDHPLHTLNVSHPDTLTHEQRMTALAALEFGKVIHFPTYAFPEACPADPILFSDALLDGKHKNVSFNTLTQRLGGIRKQPDSTELSSRLSDFMQAYAGFAKHIVDTLFPRYQNDLQWGRTSYRPAEIKGRTSSKRKDDTRLHVDSFSATPVDGRRILRIFCNINPEGLPRVWHLGEPFPNVLQRFAPNIPPYSNARARLLKLVKVTKTLRSSYDHYQLMLHDQMKLDDNYQNRVPKTRIDFPAQSTWLVFTDQASHAALSGQFLLEQTFYLPVSAMERPELSPLKCWEKIRF